MTDTSTPLSPPVPSAPDRAALDRLRSLFDDRPDLLRVLTLGDAESQQVVGALREDGGLFAERSAAWAAGRTGSGKTSLGNTFFGSDRMASTGHTDCTFEIGLVELPSGLSFVDTPGGGSNEEYENHARLALGLPQLDEDTKDSVTLRAFAPPGAAGPAFVDEVVPRAGWAGRSATFRPDVVVFFVAPHFGVMRPDRHYLQDVLRTHPSKVVVALNLFRGPDGSLRYTPQNLEDAHKAVAAVIERVVEPGSPRPRVVEIDAKSGSGVDELIAAVCAVLPPDRIGTLEAVLRDELRPRARRERDHAFLRSLHGVATRLARAQVDQQAFGQDMLELAAVAVAEFAVATYAEAAESVLPGDLADRAGAVRAERTETLTTTDVVTRKRDIVERRPIIVSKTRNVVEKRTRTVTRQDRVEQGFGKAVAALGRAAYGHLETAARGGSQAEHDTVNRRLHRELNPTVSRDELEEYDVPHVITEQVVDGYTDKVVDTVDAVASLTEREVGTKAHRGGADAVALLLGVGHGVRDHILEAGPGAVETSIDAAAERVEAVLAPLAEQLERLLAAGDERAATALLDERFVR